MCTEDVVQMFLLGAVVFAFAGDSQSQQIAIKAQARFCVSHNDCSVINSEKELVGVPMPFLLSLIRRELQNLKWMAVGIFEIESLYSRGILVPVWQALRPRRRVLDLVLAEPG